MVAKATNSGVPAYTNPGTYDGKDAWAKYRSVLKKNTAGVINSVNLNRGQDFQSDQ